MRYLPICAGSAAAPADGFGLGGDGGHATDIGRPVAGDSCIGVARAARRGRGGHSPYSRLRVTSALRADGRRKVAS